MADSHIVYRGTDGHPICQPHAASANSHRGLSLSGRHITAPPPFAGESRWHRVRDAAQFYWDFSQIPTARQKRLELVDPSLRPLVKEINRRQGAGEDMHYSLHIYREVRWLLNFTSDIAATNARISALRQSLTQTEEQKRARDQQASDGSWGLGINAWYLRFYYSVDDVQ